MAFLKTILTYSVPSEAEVDQSLLRANGFTVNLMNSEITRSYLGRAFDIQLQVPDDEAEAAIALLREFRPERFGSVENVRKIEQGMRRSFREFALAFAVAAVAAFFTSHTGEPPAERVMFSLFMGILLGLGLWLLYRFVNRMRSNP